MCCVHTGICISGSVRGERERRRETARHRLHRQALLGRVSASRRRSRGHSHLATQIACVCRYAGCHALSPPLPVT